MEIVLVSIPFIAGQWSLPSPPCGCDGGSAVFQSPSLRGSGRFSPYGGRMRKPKPAFQSPSLRGSGRFIGVSIMPTTLGSGFNPLHCGAVVASRGRE